MKITTILLSLAAVAFAAGTAAALTINTWHWAPSPETDSQGRALPAPAYYEVFISTDGGPEEFVETVTDTIWQHVPEQGATYRLRVRAVDSQGRFSPMSEPSEAWTAPVVSSVPGARTMSVGPAVPNPFNPVTSISYVVPEDVRGPVSMRVVDVRGRLVRTLDVDSSSGEHAVRWHGTDDRGQRVPAGVYLVQFRCGAATSVTKMTLVE